MPTHPITQAIESISERVKSFSSERHALARELEQVIAHAQALLADLGEEGAPRRGRPRGRRKGGPGRRRGVLSAAGRKAISDAQKARWAKLKATKKPR